MKKKKSRRLAIDMLEKTIKMVQDNNQDFDDDPENHIGSAFLLVPQDFHASETILEATRTLGIPILTV